MTIWLKTWWGGAPALALLGALAACGGGGGSPTGPSGGSGGGGGGGGGTPGPSGATVTIGTGGVSPSQVTISVGQSVTFVNNSGGTRNVSSDPHPAHTDCPAFVGVAILANGQTKLTNAFTTARACGYHDHDDPDTARWKGTVVVQ